MTHSLIVFVSCGSFCVCVCVCVLVVCVVIISGHSQVRMYGAFATLLGPCWIRSLSADPLRIRSAVRVADPLRSDVVVMMHFWRMREVGSLCQHGCADPQMHADERVESEVVCAPAVCLLILAHCDNHALKCAVCCCCMLCLNVFLLCRYLVFVIVAIDVTMLLISVQCSGCRAIYGFMLPMMLCYLLFLFIR